MNLRLPADASRYLQSEAERRTCTPQALATALITCVAKGELVDAVLDGTDPSAFSAIGRTSIQVRVLKALRAYEAPNGTMTASFGELGARLGVSRGSVSTAVAALIAKGFLDQVTRGQPGAPSRYRMTPMAIDLLAELAP